MGFDSINRTFKIVRVLSFSKSLVTEVHTLGTESWRHISSVPSCNSLSATGVSACGDMHWTNGLPECKIISFNFQQEEFNLTPHPDFGMLQYRKDFMLVNLKGFLAVVNFPQPTDIEIWVLKDYENKVWMRECRLTTKIYVNRVSSVSACCDGIFFHCGQIRELLFLHLRRNLILKTTCWGKRLAKAIFSYTASVVSLKNFGNLVADDDSKWCMIADLVEDDPMCSITWTNRAQTNVKGQRRLRFGLKIFRPPNGHWL
ncbi:hypothetical protein Ddye_003461 [Dipteronia dyeriana]|uniref:F-box associated beta-propeller type 3 domain-containing protein n=1 Tax=Dipteronia dyeriana TaxID=168575 RepID=A0AAE0CVB7_9ROSI|nr:hypothetical protein Ddye_003461 [Dipteronia dyeriana]